MDEPRYWIGVLGGTAAWLVLYSRPGLATVAGMDLFLPVLLGLGPVVALSIYMDVRALKGAEADWQPRPVVYVAPALLFPAVVGPLYLFFRLLYVEMQEDEEDVTRGDEEHERTDDADGRS